MVKGFARSDRRRALLLLLLVGVLAWPLDSGAQSGCRSTRVNWLSATRQPIPVGATAVTVAEGNTSRCILLIFNASTESMQCADVSKDPVPTATTGIPVIGGAALELQLEGQGRWQCIRSGAADAAAVVAEALP